MTPVSRSDSSVALFAGSVETSINDSFSVGFGAAPQVVTFTSDSSSNVSAFASAMSSVSVNEVPTNVPHPSESAPIQPPIAAGMQLVVLLVSCISIMHSIGIQPSS